jgi:D-alanine--D-alanine ligase
MRIALTHNVRLTDSVEEAEFDSSETIDRLVGALSGPGHHVERVEVTGPASRLVARLEAFAPDLIFNTAEGRRGKTRRAFYASLFEQLGIPSTGSDPYALSITQDKALTKKVLAGFGISSPRGRFIQRESLHGGGLDDLIFPVIIKPNFEGSSKGITQESVVEDAHDLARIIDDQLMQYSEGLLVERYVPGIDVRAIRIDGVGPLPPVEIVVDEGYRRRHEIYDYALKHRDAKRVTRRVPARITTPLATRVTELSRRAFDALGLRDAACLDFRVGDDGEVYFLSASALPNFAADTAMAAAAAHAGLDFDTMVLATLRAAAARHGLLSLLDATTPRPRGPRPSLRVGFAFNMKRIESHDGDDREAEYDSPRTIEAIADAIASHGHVVVPLEATVDFPRVLMASNVDVVFNVAEGISGRNREAQVPNLCELIGIPYTGSDSATLSICLDKALAKRMLVDIDTPAFQVLFTGREKLRSFRYPVIVKHNAEGTSKGITQRSVVSDEASARAMARELIDRYRQPAIVEEYIVGREFTVGLLGERRPRVLPPMEVVFLAPTKLPVYDYACKQDWQAHVRYECPARLSQDELRAMERVCRSTFMKLGCRDVARIDLRMTDDGRIYVIEVNPLPGLTPDYSDLCLISNATKMDYRTLIGEILSGGLKRFRERKGEIDASRDDVEGDEVDGLSDAPPPN